MITIKTLTMIDNRKILIVYKDGIYLYHYAIKED